MGEKRELTAKEYQSIPQRLRDKYKKLGYISYIDVDDEKQEVKWGTETQVLFEKIETTSVSGMSMPKYNIMLTFNTLYAHFLWIILFLGLVIFTILLMHFDFNAQSMYHGVKKNLVEFFYSTNQLH